MPLTRLAYYVTPKGRAVVREVLEQLPQEDQGRVVEAIERVMAEFPEVASISVRHLRYKVWELRLTLSVGEFRVLYAPAAEGRLLVLHAFVKKTQKTPKRDLALALYRREEMTS